MTQLQNQLQLNANCRGNKHMTELNYKEKIEMLRDKLSDSLKNYNRIQDNYVAVASRYGGEDTVHILKPYQIDKAEHVLTVTHFGIYFASTRRIFVDAALLLVMDKTRVMLKEIEEAKPNL